MLGNNSMLLLWCFSCAISSVFGEDGAVKSENHSLPRIVLARKHISRDALVVESNKLLLNYEVFNLGDVPAVDVTVTDEINTDWFDIVGGSSNVRIAELEPQGRYAYNVTVVPKKYGSVVVDRAIVQYTISGIAKRMVSSSYCSASCHVPCRKRHNPFPRTGLEGSTLFPLPPTFALPLTTLRNGFSLRSSPRCRPRSQHSIISRTSRKWSTTPHLHERRSSQQH